MILQFDAAHTGDVMTVMRTLIILLLFSIPPGHVWSQDGFTSEFPRIGYWKIGTDSTTVIILHGGPGAAHNYLRPEWDTIAKTSTVVYYDQRGCGKSERSNCYSWQHHVNDLRKLIRTIKPEGKVILAGSSWGTVLALLYAYLHPEDVKGIILSGTVAWKGKGGISADCSEDTSAAKSHLSANAAKSYLSTSAAKSQISASDTLTGYICLKKDLLINSAGKTTLRLRDMIDQYKCFESNIVSNMATNKSLLSAPTLTRLRSLKVPILIFKSLGMCHVESRPYLKDAAHQFEGILPNAEIFPIHEACHDPWLTHKEIFFKKSMAFIDGLK